MTLKHKFGNVIIPALPINRRTFEIFRFELNAFITRTLSKLSPKLRKVRRELTREKNLKVNIGSGGAGREGWINLDIRRHHKDQTIPCDIRYGLPFEDNQVRMLMAEHVVEHLDFREDVPRLLNEMNRVLEPGGHLRIVVPDGERWLRAYVSRDSDEWLALGMPELPDDMPTPMAMINHIFHQGGEHLFAYDFETISYVLKKAGFNRVSKKAFGESEVGDLAIDLPHHASYSLYVEAAK